jgi:hypothetical protein
VELLMAHRVDEHGKSLNTDIELHNPLLIVKAWNHVRTHLNSAVEKTVVLTGAVEQSLGVCQLMLIWRCEEVHGEVAHHRRFVGCHVRLEVRADRHFMAFRLNYHVVIAVGRLLIFTSDCRRHLSRRRTNVG